MKNSTIFQLVALLAVTSFALTARAEHVLRFSSTVEGALAMTGNTLGLSKAKSENGPGVEGSIGTFITTDLLAVDDSPPNPSNPWPTGTTNNWRENRSSGELDLPEGSTVLYAELIWGGSWAFGGENVSTYLDSAITLRFEGGDSASVEPDADTAVTLRESTGSTWSANYYLRSADVTDFVAEHGMGIYTAGGIPATQNHMINSLNAAGWTLVVAYANPELQSRNLTIFVGADWVGEQDETDYDVTGFCTPPLGPVEGRVLLGAIEGDAGLGGDQVLIGSGSAGTFVELSAPNNPVDNFFSSQINDIDGLLDTRGTFGDVNHDPDPEEGVPANVVGGRQSWDMTGVTLSKANGELENDQSLATIRATSGADADSYVATLVAFEVSVNSPVFSLDDSTSVNLADATVGDTLTYRIELDNSGGTADAVNVELFFPLALGLSLDSFTLDGTPDTDITAEDLVEGVIIGDIDSGASAVVIIEAIVNFVPAPPDPAGFVSRAKWQYDYVSCTGEDAISAEVVGNEVAVGAVRLLGSVRTVNDALNVGDVVVVTATIENDGTADTAAATLQAPIPTGLLYEPGTTTMNGSSVSDSGGSMPFASGPAEISSDGLGAGVIGASESAVVAWNVRVAPAAPARIDGLVTFDADGIGPSPSGSADYSLTVAGGGSLCGNSTIDAGESCDDGNASAGDGCSDTCQQEDGWICQGEPSVCLPDRDNDGLPDDLEDSIGTDPDDPDSDDDGLSDGVEYYGDNPTDPLDADSDDDELCDGPRTVAEECASGEDTNADGHLDSGETNPNDNDTDDGTVLDGVEVFRGTNPLDPTDDLGELTKGEESCGCSSTRDTAPAGAWLSLALVGLVVVARRRR